jgi:lipopolysaccharide export system permease protein
VFPLFGLVHRMIFWELVKVFLLALAGLTGLFLAGGLIQQAAQMGLSPAQVLRAIPLIIPNALPYTIPATTLFATCVVYGRLSTDNEIVALKAAGVDVLTTLRPAVLLGVLAMLVTGGLYYSLIPKSQQRLKEQLLQDPEEVIYNLLKREKRYATQSSPYTLHVRDVQGRRLIDVVVKRKAPPDPARGTRIEYDYVARAREARIVVNLETRRLTVDAEEWVVAGSNSTGRSEGNPPMELELPEMFSEKEIKSRVNTLEWTELPGRRLELMARRDNLTEIRDRNRAEAKTSTDPVRVRGLVDQDMLFDSQVREATKGIRAVEYEMQLRPALAVACLCFALIGCPVGIWFNRSDYLSTFVICFIPALAVYYPLLFSGGGLAKDGKIPMALGVWAADAVIGLGALVLTWRLIRR